MNDSSERTRPTPTLASRREINQICERFEQAWRAAITHGEATPNPANYLISLEPVAAAELRRELLYVDVDYGLGLATPFSLAEFKLRWPHPELGDELEQTIARRQPSWEPGQLVAQRYRIIQMLGRGGMGEVYLAADRELNEQVALKRLRVGSWDLLRREVGLARKVTHEHVCRVFDLGPTDQQPFFSMEYVAGQTLDKLLKSTGALTEKRALCVAEQICLGLQAAHAKQVLHRDLKPGNVLIDERGDVRLTDFGLACVAEDEHAVAGGTLVYMSPEQLSGGKVTAASDIYSLGLLLFELYTGRRLFQTTTIDEALAERRQFQLIEQPEDFQLPSLVRETIGKCLALRPEDRPPSADSVSKLLSGTLESIADRATNRTWNRPLAIGVLAIVVLGLAVIVGLADGTSLVGKTSPRQPWLLDEDANKVLRKLDLPAPADSATGFVSHRVNPLVPENTICFFKRQSPTLLLPNLFFPIDYRLWQTFCVGHVTLDNPVPLQPGMASVLLDSQGGLLRLHVVQDTQIPTTARVFALAEWIDFLPEDCRQLEWRKTEQSSILGEPILSYDNIQQWTGTKGDSNEAWQLTVAHQQGRLVYLDCASQAVLTERANQQQTQSTRLSIGTELYFAILLLAICGALGNIWLGRCDLRSALKVAVAVSLTALVGHYLVANHVWTMNELDILEIGLAMSLYLGFIAWVAYVAYEPLVRRYLPDSFITWGRLLTGRVNDWLIGRDLLIGIALAVFSMALTETALTVLDPARSPLEGLTNGLISLRQFIGHTCIWWSFCTALSLLMLVSLVLVRRVLPRGAARIACILLWTVPFMTPFASTDWLSVGISIVLTTLTIVVLEKYGFFPIVVSWLVRILLLAPLTADANRWYASLSTGVVLLLLCAAAYGAWSSLRRRRKFAILATLGVP